MSECPTCNGKGVTPGCGGPDWRDTGVSTCSTCLGRGRVADANEPDWKTEAAESMRGIAYCLGTMADALEDGDDILGPIAGAGLANLLPALPSHIRAVFMEHLSDEAAAGYRADQRYFAAEQENAA